MIEEKFALGNSVFHKADPVVKLVGAACLLPFVAVNDDLKVILMGLFFGIFFVLLASLELRHVLKHLVVVNIFMFFLWIVLPFSGSGEVLYYFGPLAVYKKGVELPLLITLKANGVSLLIISLLSTSSVQRLGNGLRQLGVSVQFTILLLTTFRYLGVIMQEYGRLRRAAKLRRFKPGLSLHTYRTYAYLIAMTFVRSYEQGNRVNNAMIMRGFSGTFPIMDLPSKNSDYKVGTLLALSFTILIAVSII
ncbi:MAG: cobalt ECF transporter T component CbiQ [Desulfobulbaceae bacterium]|nr:cobalt ECF transporter T component CbiQ [Desulfobulbaceae bacterium]